MMINGIARHNDDNVLPGVIGDYDTEGNALVGPGLFEAVNSHGESFITNVRRIAGQGREPGSVLIACAGFLLFALGLGLLYVSFKAQFTYIFAAKHQNTASIIEALMLDCGLIILSLLALGLSRAGKSSRTQRFLIMVCACGSAAMNYAASDTASPRSVAAYVAAPVFLAVVVDQVIAVVRRHVLKDDETSAWSSLGAFAVTLARLSGVIILYALRTALAPPETLKGLRRMVLDAAPIPGVIELTAITTTPEVPAIETNEDEHQDEDPHGMRCQAEGGCHYRIPCPVHPIPESDESSYPEFATKKAAFLARYRGHQDYGVRSELSRVASEIAPQVGLQAGTGRTYGIEELRRLAGIHLAIANGDAS